jgi:hypothetical protein
MRNFENRIKEELSNARSMEGLDSEVLWKVISASAFVDKKKKKRIGFYWLIFSMCVVLSLIVFCFTIQPKKNGLNVANNKASETKMHRDSHLQTSGKSELGQNQSMELTASSQNSSDSEVKRFINETGMDMLNRGFKLGTSLQTKEENTAQKIQSLIQVTQESEDRLLEYSYAEIISGLTPCPPTKLIIGPISKPILRGLFKDQDAGRASKNRSWQCYAGPLWAHQTYTNGAGSLSDSLNADLSSEWGLLAGGMVEIKKGQNWFLQTGLEWANWKDRFDKVIFSDTLLFVNQQAVMGKNIRTIRHHNSLSTLSIPIQFGMYKDWGPLRLGIQLGVSYSLILQQEGRLLKDDVTVFNYSQNQKRYTNFFSFRLAPSMGYLLNERLFINFSCFLAMQRHQSMAVNELKSKSNWIAPTIGFVYNY